MRSSLSAHHDVEFHLTEAARFAAASKPHHAAFHLGLARELAGAEVTSASSILPPSNRPRIGSTATRQYYWQMYDAYVRKAASHDRRGTVVRFRQPGYALGGLSQALALQLQDAVMTAPIARYSSAERLPGFIASNYDSKSDTAVNGHSQFRALDPAGQALLGEALAQMRDDVASCLGSPWRVVAIKSWTTPPGKAPVDMYGWHGDEWVEELFKIMIYLTPMTRTNGGLEIYLDGRTIFLESPDPGKWVLFRNSDLLHRGVPGSDSVRAVIEISLARALASDLRLRFPGLNAHWPEFPWVDSLEGANETTIQPLPSPETDVPSSTIRQTLIALVNRFASDRRLFKIRRRVERFKRLYLSSHPQ
jgi:hypothetical protein